MLNLFMALLILLPDVAAAKLPKTALERKVIYTKCVEGWPGDKDMGKAYCRCMTEDSYVNGVLKDYTTAELSVWVVEAVGSTEEFDAASQMCFNAAKSETGRW